VNLVISGVVLYFAGNDLHRKLTLYPYDAPQGIILFTSNSPSFYTNTLNR
jgi:hypothetical protein